MNSLPSINRREFLRRGLFAAAAAPLGVAAIGSARADTNKKIPIGLQLYSLREQCASDLPGMLRLVSRVGYKGVEFAGYHGRTAAELRAMLQDNGLVACGTHTPYESVLGERLGQTIQFNQTIGNKFLIVPSMSARSKEQWLARAKLFNQLAAKLKAQEMWIGYHAHANDFKMFDGQTGWDLFFGNTNPEVIMQLDTGNCCEGGADPIAVLQKYPGRARSIHVKAFGAGPDAVIGEDKIDWPRLFAFCESQGGTQWYVLEHESSRDPIRAVTRSFEALKKMGKV